MKIRPQEAQASTSMPLEHRPTVAPPFDPVAFARESESRLRSVRPARERAKSSVSATLSEPPQPPESAVYSSAREAVPVDPIDLETVPRVLMKSAELRSLPLDAFAGFILSQIDGVLTVEMILDVSGMPAPRALEVLGDLAQRKVISLR